MAVATSVRGNTPPYVPFPSFKTLIADLHEHGVPSRIDRSVLKRFSGITGTQLLTALRFLKLIDEAGTPAPRLKEVADAHGTQEWGPKMIALLQEAYAPIFGLDLGSATASHFDETFRKSFPGADSVSQKSIAFFLAAAKDSGIIISDRVMIGRKTRSTNGNTPRKPRAPKVTAKADKKDSGEEAQEPDAHLPAGDFRSQLLSKFPPFNPAWPDDIKAKWFDGYERLLGMGETKSGNPETK